MAQVVKAASAVAKTPRKRAPKAPKVVHTGPVLHVGPVWSTLKNVDKSVLSQLKKNFTVVDKEFFQRRSIALAQGRTLPAWARFPKSSQSYFHLTGKFVSGLLPEVTSKLDELNLEYATQYTKELEVPEYDNITPDYLGSSVKMHDYQVSASNAALAAQRGIIKCATGGGKTVMFTSILKAMQGRYPALVLFRNKSLVSQTYDVFKTHGLNNIGRVTMDHFEPAHITCATIQSMHKLGHLIPQTKALIVDEVHEFTSKKSIELFEQMENAIYRLGFSATPFKHDDEGHNMALKAWFGPLLTDISFGELRSRDILSDSVARFYPVNVGDDLRHRWGSDYGSVVESGIVENEELNRKIAKLVDSIPEGRILILVQRLRHGDLLQELIPGSFWIRGEDSAETREHVLSQLRKSDSKKVVAIMSSIGYYGLNVFVHHLINVTGGKDATMLIQKIGRGLRKSDDKERLEYHDFILTGNRWLENHSKERMETLRAEGHKVVVERAL